MITASYLQMLLPCDQPYLRAAVSQRPTYPVRENEFLPYDVENNLLKLIAGELRMARESERLKQDLAKRYDYNLNYIFKEVDDINLNHIDSTCLKRFLIKTGTFPNDNLLIAIIRRFDLDGDAKLKFQEFKEGVRSQIEDIQKASCHGEKYQTLATSRILSASKAQKSSLNPIRSQTRTNMSASKKSEK